jgi:hypothetical protein
MMHIPLHLFAAALFWDGSHAGTKPRISIVHKITGPPNILSMNHMQ